MVRFEEKTFVSDEVRNRDAFDCFFSRLLKMGRLRGRLQEMALSCGDDLLMEVLNYKQSDL